MTSLMITKEESVKIQVLRGISIIAVIFIHVSASATFYGQLFLRPFLNFAVPCFIFLSGYLTKLPVDNYAVFAKKRLKKVLVPYFIWSTVYMAHDKVSSIGDIINYYLTGYSILYYLVMYSWFVVLTPVIGKLLMSKKRWIGWIITPVWYIAYKYLPMYVGGGALSTGDRACIYS